YVLGESPGAANELAITIGLGGESGTRTYRFDIDATFNPASLPSAVQDTLAVYLVDPQDPTHTLLDRGEQGTALFMLSRSQAEFASGPVRYAGSTVELDLTGLEGHETG